MLEDRIVGSNSAQTNNLISSVTSLQLRDWLTGRSLIDEHIEHQRILMMRLNTLCVWTGLLTGTVEPRTIGRIGLHKAVLDILAVDNLGIRVVRRNPIWSHMETIQDTYFIIHKGVE